MQKNIFTRTCIIEDSSNIARIDWAPTTLDMVIEFISGEKYLYKDVRQTEFALLVSSDSVGKVFNQLFRDGKYEKLEN